MDGVEDVDAGLRVEGERGQVEREAGAADDDPLGEREQALGLAPAGQALEAVGADEVEEGGVGVLGA